MKYLVQPIVCHSLNTPGTQANQARNFAISAPQHGLVLCVPPGQTYLQPQPWTGEAHQTFRFIPVDGEWCVIEIQSSGKVLDVEGGASYHGARICEWNRHNGHNQQFRLLEGDPGRTFLLEARHSGMVIDLSDYKQGAGGMVYQSGKHGQINQQWILTEVKWNADISDLSATIYADANFQGASQTLGIGSFNLDKIRIGNDTVSSIKVPNGLRVTVYPHEHFQGTPQKHFQDIASLGTWNDRISSIVVEKVATLHGSPNYGGTPYRFGIGRYLVDQLWIGNDRLQSLRVPQGLMVLLFEHDNFTGECVSVTEDMATLPSPWNGNVSSVIVKQTGLYLPDDALRYGGRISLTNVAQNTFLEPANGDLGLTNTIDPNGMQKFTLVRSGKTKLRSHVCYGDIVSLKTPEDMYVVAEKDGTANANRTRIGEYEKWEVIRCGDSSTKSFVCMKDVIALRSTFRKYLVAATPSGGNLTVMASATNITADSGWRINGYKPANAVPPSFRTSACGGDACAANVCASELCGADACAAATCSAAASLVSTCVAAASSIAACAIDIGGAAVGGISACVAAATGLSACGADVCGAALCGAAACGTAACGAAACGADACGVAASGAALCVGNAGGIDVCGADACVANACGVNLCPSDFCAVDVCAVDVIPIIPFI